MVTPPLLQVDDLHVRFPAPGGDLHAVRGVSFEVRRGERVAVVGESGSGKSVTALSLVGLTPRPGRLSGSVKLKGRELVGLSERQLTRVRGLEMGVILQDATAALDPLKSIGDHIVEALRLHTGISRRNARARALELIGQVRISDPELRVGQCSHELSGGMAQRAVTASVIGLEPELLIADEPTSALDATTANGVLDLLLELGRARDMAVVLITHDLGIVARFAERVIVMYAGRIVEQGTVGEIFSHPRHPYTRALLESVPGSRRRPPARDAPTVLRASSTEGCRYFSRCTLSGGREACTGDEPVLLNRAGPPGQLSACHFADELPPRAAAADEGTEPRPPCGDVLLRVDGLDKQFHVRHGTFGRRGSVRAVEGADLVVRRGEVLALVGESGSGKTTLGKVILGLEAPSAGRVTFDDTDISGRVLSRTKNLQRRVQVVFQNPNSSLDPRMKVGPIVAEPLEVHRIGTPAERRDRVVELLEQVGLDAASVDRYPFEFSGGQRQRIAIARALAPRPDLLICDEPLTALDVSVQAQILDLLHDIQRRDGLAYLFIAHDLSVVREIADRVAVMYLGHIVETADADELFRQPHHPYTKALLSAMTVADPAVDRTRERIILRGAVPSPLDPPPGCPFHTRCWKAEDICRQEMPPLVEITAGRRVACHLPEGLAPADGAPGADLSRAEAS